MEGSDLVILECTDDRMQKATVMEEDEVLLFPVNSLAALVMMRNLSSLKIHTSRGDKPAKVINFSIVFSIYLIYLRLD